MLCNASILAHNLFGARDSSRQPINQCARVDKATNYQLRLHPSPRYLPWPSPTVLTITTHRVKCVAIVYTSGADYARRSD